MYAIHVIGDLQTELVELTEWNISNCQPIDFAQAGFPKPSLIISVLTSGYLVVAFV